MIESSRPADATDILVIGAGPAGLAAAAFAGSLGFDVTILDENALPGGQYYRQSRLDGSLPERIVGPSQGQGRALIGRLDPARVRLCCDTLVWGMDGPQTVLYTQDGQNGRISARAIVLATGAHERVLPFPGWTLPGVMTAGAAQTLLKSQAILPGKEIVIAGTGPFLYPVATQLAAAGAGIAAICELSRSRLWPLAVSRPWRFASIYREAAAYLTKMLRHGLRIERGTTVVEAHGDAGLSEVTIAELDAELAERPGTRRTVRADTLLTSFGFVPNLQVARLLGCALRWDPVLQSWFVETDEDLGSSVPGVFVAGEIAGIAGHRVARLEGMLAAAGAAAFLKPELKPDLAERTCAARRSRADYRDFAAHMAEVFQLRPAVLDLARPDTIVCRCESVVRSEIEHHAALWQGSARAVKQNTRAGMGRCQGRICGHAVAALVRRHAADLSLPPALDPPRLPVKPLQLSDVASGHAPERRAELP